jgi:hypothetical protein
LTIELRTGRYHTHRWDHGVAVAISIGKPTWPLPYELAHEIRELMPWGLLGRDVPADEFAARYIERLDAIDVAALRHRVAAIAATAPGRPLVLLCWEKPGQFCHRHIAAAWLERHGFGPVSEVATERQLAMDLGREP